MDAREEAEATSEVTTERASELESAFLRATAAERPPQWPAGFVSRSSFFLLSILLSMDEQDEQDEPQQWIYGPCGNVTTSQPLRVIDWCRVFEELCDTFPHKPSKGHPWTRGRTNGL